MNIQPKKPLPEVPPLWSLHLYLLGSPLSGLLGAPLRGAGAFGGLRGPFSPHSLLQGAGFPDIPPLRLLHFLGPGIPGVPTAQAPPSPGPPLQPPGAPPSPCSPLQPAGGPPAPPSPRSALHTPGLPPFLPPPPALPRAPQTRCLGSLRLPRTSPPRPHRPHNGAAGASPTNTNPQQGGDPQPPDHPRGSAHNPPRHRPKTPPGDPQQPPGTQPRTRAACARANKTPPQPGGHQRLPRGNESRERIGPRTRGRALGSAGRDRQPTARPRPPARHSEPGGVPSPRPPSPQINAWGHQGTPKGTPCPLSHLPLAPLAHPLPTGPPNPGSPQLPLGLTHRPPRSLWGSYPPFPPFPPFPIGSSPSPAHPRAPPAAAAMQQEKEGRQEGQGERRSGNGNRIVPPAPSRGGSGRGSLSQISWWGFWCLFLFWKGGV
ncbi:basic salivary proline-rich protein 1-like [Manacus candei]|uniref:basic salivary proline-rich protein 1-like n=1 Tax=Manacus candei TaxID=415023 RepID=UPI002226C67A|nr:basic salivary proline-rich protein 1-like [Manacus candei]